MGFGTFLPPRGKIVGTGHATCQFVLPFADCVPIPTNSVIPHHHHAYGQLPAADITLFARTLTALAPATAFLTLALMETLEL